MTNPNPYIFNPQLREDLTNPVAPVLVTGATVSFDYIVGTTTISTLTLPNPLYGNQEEVQPQRIQRSSRGGTLITYRDSDWSIDTIHKIAFDSLSIAQRLAIQAFVDLTLGKPVIYNDYEGRSWSVLIINPNGDFSETSRLCGHTWEVWLQILEEV